MRQASPQRQVNPYAAGQGQYRGQTLYRPQQPIGNPQGAYPGANASPYSRPGGNQPQTGGTQGFSGGNPYGTTQQQSQPRAGNNSRAADPGQFTPNHPGRNQQHLGSWMDSHQNQPLAQQQRALEQEPGFHQLAPEQQQRMRDRLTELNRMDPRQRQSIIDRTEAMARLSPQQRQQVRSAAGELGSLPPNRQRAVAQAFRGLQSMPLDQRQSYMNSPQFRQQFTDGERGTLNNLMQVSPYLPMRQPQNPR